MNNRIARNLSKLKGREGPKEKFKPMMKAKMTTNKHPTVEGNDASDFWIIILIYINIINYLTFKSIILS